MFCFKEDRLRPRVQPHSSCSQERDRGARYSTCLPLLSLPSSYPENELEFQIFKPQENICSHNMVGFVLCRQLWDGNWTLILDAPFGYHCHILWHCFPGIALHCPVSIHSCSWSLPSYPSHFPPHFCSPCLALPAGLGPSTSHASQP